MTASEETVANKVKGTTDLCNVPSIASNSKLSVNAVKKFFPRDIADSVATGDCDGSFVIRLLRAHPATEKKQLIPPTISILSSHGYQKLPTEPLSVSERNTRYLSLLESRPCPLISSESAERKLGQSSTACDFKTEKKASSAEFFNSKTATTNGTVSKKSPIKKEAPSFFQKKTKAEDSKIAKVEDKLGKDAVKKETRSPEKRQTGSSVDKKDEDTAKRNVKQESDNEDIEESKSVKIGPKASSKTPEAAPKKSAKSPKTQSKKEKKSPKDESTNGDRTPRAKESGKDSEVENETGSSARKLSENKRKRIEETSDDEEVTKVSRSKTKKLKRVAILDSDSDQDDVDENNAAEETTEKDEDECMDTSGSPVKATKKSRTKTEKPDKDQKTSGTLSKTKTEKPAKEPKTNGTSSKKNSKKTSPLKVSAAKEAENNTEFKSETTASTGNDKPSGQQRRRRRVLKEVTHTFKSEDGFLETKTVKEMVSETDSEPEEGDAAKTKPTTKPASVASTPAPRGQASLLSFFRKK